MTNTLSTRKKSVFALALGIAIAAGITTSTTPAAAADDGVFVTTLNVAARHTDCTNNNFGYKLSDRAPVVRGKKHKIRIERHLVDVSLERANVTSCSGECSADIKRKGNENGKGFVELEVTFGAQSPTGDATLVLHYFGGGTGEYKLTIVADSHVDQVQRTEDGNSAERFVLSGSGLDRFRNSFSGTRAGSSGVNLSRVSESSSSLVLDRNARNCSEGTFELDLMFESHQSCRIRDVKLPVTRDAVCSGGGGQTAPAQGVITTPPPRQINPSTPNLLPNTTTSTSTLTRPLGPAVVTTQGQMFPISAFFCANLTANTPSTVNVPKLTWGVSGTNIESANRSFDVQLINGDTNTTLDTLNLAQGFPASTPLVTKDNYAGRASTVRVVLNPRFQVGAALQTFPGCFTEPGVTQKLDPKVLIVRADSTNQINEGSRENDNDLRF